MTLERTTYLEPEPGSLARWAGLLAPASLLAERIANTGFVPAALRGKPDEITACIMYGDEIGVGPMQALASINVIKGIPQPSAQLLRALILQAGHQLVIHEATDTRCRMSGLRAGAPEAERYTLTWTIEQARSAGLLNNPTWRTYPRAMLVNRATSELARAIFADAIRGLGYVDDEPGGDLDVLTPTDGADVASETPRKAIGRRTRPKRATSSPSRDDASDRPTEAHTVEEPEPAPPSPRPVEPAPALPGVEDVPLPGDDLPRRGPGRPRLINPEQLTAVHTLISKVYAQQDRDQGDRDEKLALLAGIVEHPLASSKDLTRLEAMTVLDVLNAMLAGEATFWVHPTGNVTVDDLRESRDADPVNFDDSPDRWT